MNHILAVALDVQSFCSRQGWRFCFIGGLAVLRWGQPRVTQDVDLTLLTGFGEEEAFLDLLLSAYVPRIAEARRFALRNRVVLLNTPDGTGIDISLGALPFEYLVVDHATSFSYEPGLQLNTCSAEDLIVLKLFASRPLDLRDAETVAIRHKETLDWNYIEEQLTPLADLKEDPQILRSLARIKAI